MSQKSQKIAGLIAGCRGRDLNAHYLGYFECFNRQLFYEAHDVLEELWLPQRKEGAGDFFKGLIQLAGAFVHMQKKRWQPAQALLRLAQRNLVKYTPAYERLNVEAVLALIASWQERLQSEGLLPEDWQDCHPPSLQVPDSSPAPDRAPPACS